MNAYVRLTESHANIMKYASPEQLLSSLVVLLRQTVGPWLFCAACLESVLIKPVSYAEASLSSPNCTQRNSSSDFITE